MILLKAIIAIVLGVLIGATMRDYAYKKDKDSFLFRIFCCCDYCFYVNADLFNIRRYK